MVPSHHFISLFFKEEEMAPGHSPSYPSHPIASSLSPSSSPTSVTTMTPSMPPTVPTPWTAAPSSSSTRSITSPNPSRTPSSPPSRTAPSSSSEPPPRIPPSTSPPRFSPTVESSPCTPSSTTILRPYSVEPSQTLRKISKSSLEYLSWSTKKPSNSSLSTMMRLTESHMKEVQFGRLTERLKRVSDCRVKEGADKSIIVDIDHLELGAVTDFKVDKASYPVAGEVEKVDTFEPTNFQRYLATDVVAAEVETNKRAVATDLRRNGFQDIIG